jgi:hypothetical protein
MSKMKCKRLCVMLTLSLLLVCMMGTTAFAAGTGDVAGAVESTWQTASTQIKTVVNNVVFPAIDLILAVFFFAKLGTAYFDYRKSGQFEWTAPAILFACLVFTLTAPLYIWQIIGIYQSSRTMRRCALCPAFVQSRIFATMPMRSLISAIRPVSLFTSPKTGPATW